MQKLYFINSKGNTIDFTNGNYGIVDWQGFSEVPLEIQSEQIPFVDGSVYLDALLNTRELSITLAYNDEKDLTKRYQLRRELISILNPKLGEGVLIYVNDFVTKKIKCIANVPVFANKNFDEGGTNKAAISFSACSPYWEDVARENIFADIVTDYAENSFNNSGDVGSSPAIIFNSGDVTEINIHNVKTDKEILISTETNKLYFVETETGKKGLYSHNFNNVSESYYDLGYHFYYSEEFDKTFEIKVIEGATISANQYLFGITNGYNEARNFSNLVFPESWQKPTTIDKIYTTTIDNDFYTVCGQALFKNGLFVSECWNCDFIVINNEVYILSENRKNLINVKTLANRKLSNSVEGDFVAVINKSYESVAIGSSGKIYFIDNNFNVIKKTISVSNLIIDAWYFELENKIMFVNRNSNVYKTTDFETLELVGNLHKSSAMPSYPKNKVVMYNKEYDLFILSGFEVDDMPIGIKATRDFIHFYSIPVNEEQLDYCFCLSQKDNVVTCHTPSSKTGAAGTFAIKKINEIERLKSNLDLNIDVGSNFIRSNVPFSMNYSNKYIGV